MDNKFQNDCMTICPVAFIRTDFREKFGIPRQSGRVPELRGEIILEPRYADASAVRELDGFSHIWLIFGFSNVDDGQTASLTVRPPRLGGNRRVGVFASRSPFRPNRLGLSSVKLCSITRDERGTVLTVAGADLLDGTPIYDIKPYLPFADSHPDATGGYADGEADHRLHVKLSQEVASEISTEKLDALIACIAEDPRPSYQNDPERIYSMDFAGLAVDFTVDGDTAYIKSIK